MTDASTVPPEPTPEPRRVRIVPANDHGEVRCPLCQRLCTVAYLVGMHADHHRYNRWGTQHAELEFEITAVVRDRDAGDPRTAATVQAGEPGKAPQ